MAQSYTSYIWLTFYPQSTVNGRPTKEIPGVQWTVVREQWTGPVKNQWWNQTEEFVPMKKGWQVGQRNAMIVIK